MVWYVVWGLVSSAEPLMHMSNRQLRGHGTLSNRIADHKGEWPKATWPASGLGI